MCGRVNSLPPFTEPSGERESCADALEQGQRKAKSDKGEQNSQLRLKKNVRQLFRDILFMCLK